MGSFRVTKRSDNHRQLQTNPDNYGEKDNGRAKTLPLSAFL
jgi:hypothetical protein